VRGATSPISRTSRLARSTIEAAREHPSMGAGPLGRERRRGNRHRSGHYSANSSRKPRGSVAHRSPPVHHRRAGCRGAAAGGARSDGHRWEAGGHLDRRASCGTPICGPSPLLTVESPWPPGSASSFAADL
jgi:hypothetical protein